MNLKSMQKNYSKLTMLERLSLADQAVARDDETEIRAIIAASPRVCYSQPDYLDLYEKINMLRLGYLISRLDRIMQIYLFRLVDENRKKSSDFARLAAYLYVRATDSWQAVCDEFGIRPYFSDQITNQMFAVEALEITDKIMRNLAFTESEAKSFLQEQLGINQMQTVADETKAIREVLGLLPK